MTLDLPTPPLPDAIATIAVDGGNEIFDCCGAAALPPRSCCTSAARCSCVMGERSTATRATPSSGATAAVTSFVMRSFSGQPSIVMSTSTRTVSPSMEMPRNMPMSSIGLPISGSMTVRSASRTWASVTIASSQALS